MTASATRRGPRRRPLKPPEAPRNKLSLRPHPRTCVREPPRGGGGWECSGCRGAYLARPGADLGHRRGVSARAPGAGARARSRPRRRRGRTTRENLPHEPRKSFGSNATGRPGGGARRSGRGSFERASAFEASATALGRVSGQRALRTVRHERTSSFKNLKVIFFSSREMAGISPDVASAYRNLAFL